MEEGSMKQSARSAGLGILITLLVLVAGGLLAMYTGAYNVAATQDHTALGRWILKTGQTRSVAVRADDVPEPPPFDADMVEHGFEHYQAMCVDCHGAPGVDRGEFGQGMTPTPPDLSEEAAHWSEKELFWITKNGIKLAGMPAFGPTHSDEEIWGLVAFMRELEGMTPQDYEEWEARLAPAEGDTAVDAGHSHEPGTPAHSH
jgi:mono/diheme cytochrome c family protein